MNITKKEFKKLLLEAEKDGLNCGYGKELFRVIFCKDANEYVMQEKIGKNKWLCLHEGN